DRGARAKGRACVGGLAGGSGSGKAAVARALAGGRSPQHVALIEQDCYYRDLAHLSYEERTRVNFDHPDAIELELLTRHVEALAAGRAIDKPRYDFEQHVRMVACDRVEPRPVVLVEGILVLAEPSLRERMDLKLYVDTDPDIRLMRRIRRDLEQRGRT